MKTSSLICTETYYPRWSSGGIRSVKCTHPAKCLALANRRLATAQWEPVCGVHARLYVHTKPLPPTSAQAKLISTP